MRLGSWSLLAVLLLGAAAPAAALEEKSLATYAREIWTTRDGLPHNQVNGIAQTPEGYLWFATWEGVVRYNGQEFRTFGRQLHADELVQQFSALLGGHGSAGLTHDGIDIQLEHRGGDRLAVHHGERLALRLLVLAGRRHV